MFFVKFVKSEGLIFVLFAEASMSVLKLLSKIIRKNHFPIDLSGTYDRIE